MLLLKLLGSGLLVLATTAFGMAVAANYARRPAELRLCVTGLELLETQIGYTSTPLPEALPRVAAALHGPVSRLFSLTARALASGRGFTAGEAWLMAIDRIWDRSAMNDADRELLAALGPHLGASDREDQVKHLALARQRLAAAGSEAEAVAAREGRLWRNLGVLAGAAVALVLI
ncbi:MAG: stage III sporulation protein SpoIIIAB [Chloroflexota bacterium]